MLPSPLNKRVEDIIVINLFDNSPDGCCVWFYHFAQVSFFQTLLLVVIKKIDNNKAIAALIKIKSL